MITKDRLTIIALAVVIFLQINVENVATFFYGDWRFTVKQGDASDLIYYVQNLMFIFILLTVPYRYFKGIDKYAILFLLFLCIGKIVDQFYHPYTFEFSEISWIICAGSIIVRKSKRDKHDKQPIK